MSAADMDLAPSPYSHPDYPCSSTDHGHNLVFATVLFVVSVLALFLLHVLGTLRRRSSHKLLHALVLAAHTLSYLLVSYTLGLMQKSAYYFDEFPVWAVSLLMLLGGTDNFMASNLNDVDNWKSFHVKHLLKGALVVYIIASYSADAPQYLKPLCAIFVINVLQSYVRIKSMKMASKSHLLWKNVRPVADYMKRADQRQIASGRRLNPVTMEGYRYVVTGEHRLRKYGKKKSMVDVVDVEDMKITTVEQIWQSKGTLLCCERGVRLKDVCLSMALAKLLHRRFAGFELAEAHLKETSDFVFQGLLVGDEAYERVFRVMEVELGFVYDLYYTRYPYLYNKGCYLALTLPVIMVILCSWLTNQLFKTCKQQEENQEIRGYYWNTALTLCSMAVVTFLEVFQLYLHIASGWFKVALIRSYVRKPTTLDGCFPRTIIGLLLRFEAHRPWENKLGQYSLLQNYDHTPRAINCLHYVTLGLVDMRMKGYKRGDLVKVSTHVKRAVVDFLKGNNRHMTSGVRSLQKHGVHERLSWACGVATDGKVTHAILVWHVATTICKHQLDVKHGKQLPRLSKEDNTAIDTTSSVASDLSHYCGYLVAFAPDLLPGHSFDSVSMLQEAIDEACELLKGRKKKTLGEKCEELLSKCEDTGNDDDAPIVVQGARLARQLTGEIQDKKLQWKVLSDFWSEMILYVAPCDDAQARAHLQALTRGGEFITHLWALLTHAGVLERDHVGPLSAV